MRTLLISFCCLLWLNVAAQEDKCTHVVISTNMGDITVALYNETPIHRDNFIKLCQTHFYDSLLFHRVITDFMIQGGDPDSRGAIASKELGNGGPGYDLPAEINFPKFYHKRGALAAAREGDDVNPERRSSGSQFYIVWGKKFTKNEIKEITEKLEEKQIQLPDSIKETYMKIGGTPHLDGQYTVFGEVTEGLNIVNHIQKVTTLDNDRPFNDVVILSTRVIPPKSE